MAGYTNPDGSALVGALTPTNVGQALQVDGSGNLKTVAAGTPAETPINLNQVNGNALSATNPVITVEQIRAWIVNGQSFSATTGKQTAGEAINAGFSVFNPLASGKTLLVYSIKYVIGNNSFNTLALTTTDPAYGSALTVTNNKAGSGTTSVASATFTNTNVTSVGTANDTIGSATNTPTQVFYNGDVLVLPPGNGCAFYANVSGANAWAVSAEWIEY